MDGPRVEETLLRRSTSPPILPPLLLALLLALAACGDVDEPDGTDPQTEQRIEELEAELDRSRDWVQDLEQENEALADELAALRDASPDDGTDDGADDGAGAPIGWPDEVADAWSAEGLIDQLRVHLRELESDDQLPEGWEPGSTDWVAYEVPDQVRGTYATPGEVMADLAAAADAPLLGQDQWETTIRVLSDQEDPDLAYGALLGWGFLDDAVIGRDVRITLTRTEDQRWEPGGAEQRQHCMRGVTEDRTACI